MRLSSWDKRLGIFLALGMVASACGTSSPTTSPTATTGPTATTAAGSSAAASGSAAAAAMKIPSAPVTINVLDVAGNLQLTKGMMENFKAKYPNIVSNITYSTATAPELAGKLQAQQQGGNVQINLVMTGTDGLSAGVKNNLLLKVIPDHQDMFPGLMDNYLAPAAVMQGLAQGYGIEVVYYPSGPLLEYNPSKVTTPPTTPAELLVWAKAHPGKFEYAHPANSGPGRIFFMALPYMLGDKDPTDPVNGWANTWAYLRDLGQYINVYQTGTSATMKDLANGAVDMLATTTGWYINPIVLGTVPKTMAVGNFTNMTWVTDAQYAVIPNGVSADVQIADLDLISWMLHPDQQAISYDDGYFYPGPAVKGITLDMAPATSQARIKDVIPPQFATWIDQYPLKPSLPADSQVTAFDLWDKNIGKK